MFSVDDEKKAINHSYGQLVKVYPGISIEEYQTIFEILDGDYGNFYHICNLSTEELKEQIILSLVSLYLMDKKKYALVSLDLLLAAWS